MDVKEGITLLARDVHLRGPRSTLDVCLPVVVTLRCTMASASVASAHRAAFVSCVPVRSRALPFAAATSFAPALQHARTWRSAKSCSPARAQPPRMQFRPSRGPSPPPAERALSILPYLIPLLDSLSFGAQVFKKVPLLGQLLLPPLIPLYSVYRGIPFLAFGLFLALFSLVVRNPNISRYIRFNTYQALVLDIALIFPQLFQNSGLAVPPVIGETCSTAVFYAAALAVGYAVVRNVQGIVPDEIPGVSDAVNQQLGPY